MVNKTDRYIEKVFNKIVIRRKSPYKDWKRTDALEIKKSYRFAFVWFGIWELLICLELVIIGFMIIF